jgi:23S rRNA pseudouridine2605 synthase
MEERLQKILSAAGVCSRRAAEELILSGRITVNGEVADLGRRADPDRDDIRLDGKAIAPKEEHVYLLLNKTRGYVTTLSDEKGRKTVADLVAACGKRVYPVGRLDLDSEGLLLMTNDGDLMQNLIHPSHEVSKTYLVSAYGSVKGAVDRLSAVTDLDGEKIRPAKVELIRSAGETIHFYITIHEGKNRQIRRMCAQCDLTVKRLKRIREHTLELGDLPVGAWRYLTEAEISALKQSESRDYTRKGKP